MSRSNRGVERIGKQELRAQVAQAKGAMDSHTKGCVRCTHAGSDVLAHCGAWWELARKLHRARRKLKAYEVPVTEGMDTLPGLEQE